ncbi:hypothetical protein AVEN_224089-1 [Araneus ventricosus]|uniref:Uncharacterized protein n=1 Tax=Araneus ventricosus TaxID=182803 RepID=A0A4Y2TQK2_ARAVE|nr:hypothetical protein AVEN_224089-1 [Araneus ventricosus]
MQQKKDLRPTRINPGIISQGVNSLIPETIGIEEQQNNGTDRFLPSKVRENHLPLKNHIDSWYCANSKTAPLSPKPIRKKSRAAVVKSILTKGGGNFAVNLECFGRPPSFA